MSQRMSPDGMYYWDGAAWVSTLSPDGRYRWNGTSWAPLAAPVYAIGGPQRALREPTSWTRPLQYGVVGWYVWSILYTLATPIWLGGQMSQMMNQALQSQQSLNPAVSPPPVEFTSMMTSFVTAGLWASAILYSALFAVAIVGALKRWVWIYYVVLVLLGLTVLTLPVDLVYMVAGVPHFAGVPSFSPPSGVYALALVTGIPGAALFAWMLVALIKRGPWAMRRVA
jgi:hypothetical protein